MKKSVLAVLALLAVLTALWLAALAGADANAGGNFWALRKLAIYYTGIAALGCMSAGLLLATRPAWADRLLGGLDQAYRLHKWLGITAVSLGAAHWLIKLVPKWLVAQGWLERAAHKGGRGAESWLDLLRKPAESLGEWAIYLVIPIALLALWKRFPYRPAFLLHRVLAGTYLVLVFHGAALMPPAYWLTPLGVVMAGLMAAGSWGAALSLAGRIGARRRVAGRIVALRPHPGSGVLEVECQLDAGWPGHAAGQFAFVTFSRGEGAHPFTIASAWRDDGRLSFAIKALGDYTRALPQQVAAGDALTVEGPYGRFDFAGRGERQVWVAGGIGITPFLARLEALAAAGGSRQPVDAFYCTAAADPGFIARLRQLAEQARVRLHLRVPPQDGLLTPATLAEALGGKDGVARSDVWFCGPAGFGRALRRGLAAQGLPAGRFHQEAFEMR